MSDLWDGKERRDNSSLIRIIESLAIIAGDIKVIRTEMTTIKEVATAQHARIEDISKDRHRLINDVAHLVLVTDQHEQALENMACSEHSKNIEKIPTIEKEVTAIEAEVKSMTNKMIFASGFVGGVCALLPYLFKIIFR